MVWTSRGPYLLDFVLFFIFRFSNILPGARDDQPELGGDDGAGDGVLVTSEDGPGGGDLVTTSSSSLLGEARRAESK